MAISYAANMGPATATRLFGSEMGYTELEKRRLFLRSYQFSRKQSFSERIKKSFFRVRNRVRKVMWGRFRSVRKLMWLKLKTGLFFTRRRRFFLRNCSKYYNYYYPAPPTSCESYCFG